MYSILPSIHLSIMFESEANKGYEAFPNQMEHVIPPYASSPWSLPRESIHEASLSDPRTSWTVSFQSKRAWILLNSQHCLASELFISSFIINSTNLLAKLILALFVCDFQVITQSLWSVWEFIDWPKHWLCLQTRVSLHHCGSLWCLHCCAYFITNHNSFFCHFFIYFHSPSSILLPLSLRCSPFLSFAIACLLLSGYTHIFWVAVRQHQLYVRKRERDTQTKREGELGFALCVSLLLPPIVMLSLEFVSICTAIGSLRFRDGWMVYREGGESKWAHRVRDVGG